MFGYCVVVDGRWYIGLAFLVLSTRHLPSWCFFLAGWLWSRFRLYIQDGAVGVGKGGAALREWNRNRTEGEQVSWTWKGYYVHFDNQRVCMGSWVIGSTHSGLGESISRSGFYPPFDSALCQ